MNVPYLWDAIQSRNVRAVADHLHSSSQHDPHRPAATPEPSSFAPVEGSPPAADLGTAEAGALTRYWTVKYEARGRTYYDHVEACDAWKAGLVVFRRQSAATSTQVVREIDREEFEHLTRVPA